MFLQALLSLYTFCKMFEIVLPGEGVILLEFQKAIHFHHLFHVLFIDVISGSGVRAINSQVYNVVLCSDD